MRIDVILPALDEAAALDALLPRFSDRYRPVVVDNGSTDDTAAVARRHGALVVHEPRRGFGSACWAGTCEATSDVIAFMDADGSFAPEELDQVCAPVVSGAAELSLGARRPQPGAWPLHARVANRALAFELRRRTGVSLRDIGPMRAIGREYLLGLGMVDRRFGWPLEMVLRTARAGGRITELDVSYVARTGRSKVTGTVKGTLRAVHDMSRAFAT